MTRRSLGEENTGRRGARNVGLDERSGFSERCMSLSRHRQASEDCPGVLALQRDSKALEEPVGLRSGSVARPGRQQAPESAPGGCPQATGTFHQANMEPQKCTIKRPTSGLHDLHVHGVPCISVGD